MISFSRSSGLNSQQGSSKMAGDNDARIAVVGMAVQYAGCNNKEEFFDSLLRKESNTEKISDRRLGTKYRSDHYRPERSKYADTFCNERYGCVDENVDNEHDMLLNLAESAMNDAKTRHPQGKNTVTGRTGIVSGCLSFPMDNLQGELLNLYQCHLEKKVGANAFDDVDKWSERAASNSPFAQDERVFIDPASYVANKLGLGAVHYSLDAACASALYVLGLAQNHLVSGHADVMLCGATCLPEPFFILSGFSTFQAMPIGGGQGGVSFPLHKESAGLTPGEGGAVMVLKRLEDAERDGDHIYGTLLAATLTNAGCGLPLSPHLASEKSCMISTYERTGRDPKTVQYVEMHATGTPLGDNVEINAIKACFEGKVPPFGSTKGNFGHTLVAAGFAGMCKVLLSMEKEIIPPTPGIEPNNTLDSLAVMEAMPWPDTGGDVKRAGLSAFGFGTTNAHAVFESYRAGEPAVKLFEALPRCKLGITGMDATFGTLKGLDAFEEAIYTGGHGARDLPKKRWRFLGKDAAFLEAAGGLKSIPRGCYIEDVDVDFKRLRSPMAPEDILRPLQLLAVSTIDRAILDSGLTKGTNAAVLVGLGTDLELYRHRARVALKERLRKELKGNAEVLNRLMQYVNESGTSTSYTSYIGNLVSTRVSSQWGFTGPSFTITEGSNSVHRCIELGKSLLETNQVDAVVIAGVDMCGSAENLYVRSRRAKVSMASEPSAPFDINSDGYFIGEGCGAFVLERVSTPTEKKKVYASLDGISCDTTCEKSAMMALDQSGVSAHDVEMLELNGGSQRHRIVPIDHHYTAEGELDEYETVFESAPKKSIAVGSVHATVGDVGYASGAASVIKTALCLYNRYLPVNPRWEAPCQPWSESFYSVEHSRAWMKSDSKRRTALVSGISESRSCFSLVLSDVEGSHETANRESLSDENPRLLTVSGDTLESILGNLRKELQEFAQETGTGVWETDAQRRKRQCDIFLRLLDSTVRAEENNSTGNELVLCLVTTPAKLERELNLALRGIPRCAAADREWCSPSGSFFSPNPLRSANVAFMYGEGRAPYYGLGLGMHRVWPQLHQEILKKTTDLWTDESDMWLLPRGSSKQDYVEARREYQANQIEMFRSGVFASICFTDIARQLVGLQPKASFGLSLGEISMLFALNPRNCKFSDELTKRLRGASVWATELAVDFNALRKKWGVDSQAPVETFWQGYVVNASANAVKEAIGTNDFCRLLIVNDCETCFVGGKPEECSKVFAKLSLRMPPLPISLGMVGHCPEVLNYTEEIGHVHEMLEIPDQTVLNGCKLYTSLTNGRLANARDNLDKAYCPSTREFAGQLYAKLANFPDIVKAVNAAGHDVFVEVGPSHFRSLATKTILGPKTPHVAVAIDRPTETVYAQLLKMIAKLKAHGVPGVKAAGLYHPKLLQRAALTRTVQKPNKFLRTVGVNGRWIDPEGPLLPPESINALADPHVEAAINDRKMICVQPAGATLPKIGKKESLDIGQLKTCLLDLDQPLYLTQDGQGNLMRLDAYQDGCCFVPPCNISKLGDRSFMECHGVSVPLYCGAMAKGIASAELVIAAGKRGILASFGAGGLPMHQVRASLEKIQAALPQGPYAVNLIHSPFNPNLEKGNVDLFLEKGVRTVEASAFMALTPQVVRYRAAGLRRNGDGSVQICNRVIGKVSRTEVARMFLSPAPEKLLQQLVESGEITNDQAVMARQVPMADDITVEADSGGHTDNRPIHVILPLIINLRNRLHREFQFAQRVRVGTGGGIGCPSAAIAAFDMGAAFLVTGTINQLARQSGTCDSVRKQLSLAKYSDITMAPAADMFEQGVELQVLKKGTMFPAKAKMLYAIFNKYQSFQDMPATELARIEKRIFAKSLGQVWSETKDFYINRLKNPEKIRRAEVDGKLKMSLCFRWYLGLSSFWANNGIEGRQMDYQVWCGPAIGSFNEFIQGTYLDYSSANNFPCVTQANLHILTGAAYMKRLQVLRFASLQVDINNTRLVYAPDTPI